jgi:hypothetical protein
VASRLAGRLPPYAQCACQPRFHNIISLLKAETFLNRSDTQRSRPYLFIAGKLAGSDKRPLTKGLFHILFSVLVEACMYRLRTVICSPSTVPTAHSTRVGDLSA